MPEVRKSSTVRPSAAAPGKAEQPAGGQIGLQAASLVVDDQDRELSRDGGRAHGAGQLWAGATHWPHPQ